MPDPVLAAVRTALEEIRTAPDPRAPRGLDCRAYIAGVHAARGACAFVLARVAGELVTQTGPEPKEKR